MSAELPAVPIQMLAARGITATVDGDGDLVFEHRGRTWMLFLDAEDPSFFRLTLPNFWPIESEAERQQVLAACSHATGQTKVAKVHVVVDNVWASAEHFLPPARWDEVFDRCVSAVQVAVNTFVAAMRA